MTAGPLDYLLAGVLICLAFLIFKVKDLLTSIIIFMIFGMFVALAWVQLKAPDIALVEVIIGSALTGALFLGSLAQIEAQSERPAIHEKVMGKRHACVYGLLILALGAVFFKTAIQFNVHSTGLKDVVNPLLSQSGAKNPVTAVVLNIRGYDTLLEIGVLLITVVAIFALNAIEPIRASLQKQPMNLVLKVFIDLLTPLLFLLGVYMLWIGAYAPGGAFQAGGVLAGAGILFLIRQESWTLTPSNKRGRFLYVAGFVTFMLVGFYSLCDGQNFLTMSSAQAKTSILLIEVVTTISIALTLITLFAGCTGFLDGPKSKGSSK